MLTQEPTEEKAYKDSSLAAATQAHDIPLAA